MKTKKHTAEELLAMACRFEVASVRSRPVFAVKRRQEDGTFKWIVNDGEGSMRTSLSRKAMDIFGESSAEMDDPEHMKDTRFDTLEEAIDLARKYQKRVEAETIEEYEKAVRKKFGDDVAAVAMRDWTRKEFDNKYEPDIKRLLVIYAKCEEAKVRIEKSGDIPRGFGYCVILLTQEY